MIRHFGTRLFVILALSIPLNVLVYRVFKELIEPGSSFGADPAKEVVDHLGEWSIRMLYLTLLVSSLARITKTPALIRQRRSVGLWAFVYVIFHVVSYLGLLANFDLTVLIGDLTKRPYIIAGALGLLCLIPLAITSTNGWQRRMGRNWRKLHRLVYVAAVAVWIHLFWLEKATFEESAIYGTILLVLFFERIAHTIKRRRANQAIQRKAGQVSD